VETVNWKNQINQEILEEIIKCIQQIKYGEVIIKIHNSKVVQIEKTGKKQFLK